MTKLLTIFDKNLNQRVFRVMEEREIDYKIDTILTISASSQTITVGDSVTISGVLTDTNSVPLGGQYVKILKNNVVIDTITTNSSGVYTKTITGLGSGTHHFHTVYDGDDDYDNCFSSTVDVTVQSYVNTALSIDVPLVLVYSDEFNISGALTDSSDDGLVGETVKLLVGNTVVDTTTTTTDGEYSFTHTPVATGNHTFQVAYDGSGNYNSCTSSTVSRTVGKETSVLTVTSPINNLTTYDTTVAFTGTLTDDDGTVMDGEDIVISESGTTLTTLTTDSNGGFSGSVSGLSIGSHLFSIAYDGDNNYTSSTASRTVTVHNHTTTLSLSSTKDIIETGETATITALLEQDGSAYSGQTLTYQILNGSTVIDSGSDTTDANGEISISYTGTGIGDVDIIVSYSSLTETYAIEDCQYYNTSEVTRTSTNGSTIYDNNMSVALPTNCEISFDVWSNVTLASGQHRYFLLPKSQYNSGTTQPQYALWMDYVGDSFRIGLGKRESNNTYQFEQFASTIETYHTIKFVKNGTTVEMYVDNELKTTQTISWINNYTDYCFSMMRWSASGTSKIRNVKIKAL